MCEVQLLNCGAHVNQLGMYVIIIIMLNWDSMQVQKLRIEMCIIGHTI